jgi:hypothetical protein
MAFKDDLECEWVDTLVDSICDKIIDDLPNWQVDPYKANDLMDVPKDESPEYWRGYNKGIGDIKLMLEMIKDREA